MAKPNVCPHCNFEAEHSLLPIHTKHGSDILCGACGGLSRLTIHREKIEDSELTKDEMEAVKTARGFLAQLKEENGNEKQ